MLSPAPSPGVFMHGPTFMANPLACAVALASVQLLLSQDWQGRVAAIERRLEEFGTCARLAAGGRCACAWGDRRDRIEGIAVARLERIQQRMLAHGIWIRPFGQLVYVMPPFVIDDAQRAAVRRHGRAGGQPAGRGYARMSGKIVFVSGIDTEIGKTVVTGAGAAVGGAGRGRDHPETGADRLCRCVR